MAVQTSHFGGVRLTGKDAESFRKRLDEPASKQAARAVDNGRQLVTEYKQKGYVRLAPKR